MLAQENAICLLGTPTGIIPRMPVSPAVFYNAGTPGGTPV